MTSVPFLLAQSVKTTNWLTPVWLISLGVAAGAVLVVLMMLKIVAFQKVPGINSVNENPIARMVAGIVTGLIYLGIFAGFGYWQYGAELAENGFVFPLCFAVLVSFLLGFGVWGLVSRRMIGETWGLLTEGFLGWVNLVVIGISSFAVIGFLLAAVNGFGVVKFVDDPNEFISSLARLPYVGTETRTIQVAPSSREELGQAVAVNFLGSELKEISFVSNRRLDVAAAPMTADFPPNLILEVPVTEEEIVYRQLSDGRGKIPLTQIDNLYINYFASKSSSPAEVTMRWTTAPIYDEVAVIPLIAIGVVGIYLFYLIFATMFPKVFAIAHATFKTEIGQPLFVLVMIIGGLFILGSIYVPYNTFGEDIKMYKDSGLTLIRVMAIFLAIWAASKSVAEEIEGRTALTVLSKPVGRRQFILGKFTGISLAIGLVFLVLGFWFVVWVAYKPIYDYKEAAKGICDWPVCFEEAIHVVPGIFLCFLEVLVFVAISVAISTRMGILANFLICFSIYVLGHLTPLLVQSSLASFEPVVVFGNLIAIVFPVLNHFDVQAAINNNEAVPWVYLGWSIVYTMLYGSITLLLALVLFEDRDLA